MAILETLADRDIRSPALTRAALPAALVDGLAELLADHDNIDLWIGFSHKLHGAGLNASAMEVLNRISLFTTDQEENGVVAQARVDLEQRLGMSQAAAIDKRVLRRLSGHPNDDVTIPELESDGLYVQMARHDPQAHAELIGGLGVYALVRDPLRDPGLTKGYFQQSDVAVDDRCVDDCSFFVMDADGRPVVQVEADVLGGRYVGCRETGIEITTIAPDHPLLDAAQHLAVRQLRLVVEWAGTHSALVEWRNSQPPCSALADWLKQFQAQPNLLALAWIDLSMDEESIIAGYRQNHRRALRWGMKNMQVTATDTPDPDMLAQYNQVFRASRRPMALPADQLASYLAAGRMSLYIGHYESRPVATLVISHHCDVSYYWASAKLFDSSKPLGHALLHHAVVAAKARGQSRLDFGILHIGPTYTEKLHSIAHYKRGFATHCEDILHVGAKL